MAEPRVVPMPGDWHPYYNEPRRAYLERWLNGGDPPHHVIQYPVPRPPRLNDELGPSLDTEFKITTLTKAKCWGPAPYVGRPFVYIWPAAYDDHGRCIAGKAKIEYTMSEVEWRVMYV